jgi:hypothetical protein
MKKILSVATVFALLVVGAVSAKAAVDLGNGYSLNGTGNIAFYGASKSLGAEGAEPSTLTTDGENYRFELYLNKAFDNGGKAVLRLRSGDREFNTALGNFRGAVNDQSFGGNGGNSISGTNANNLITLRELYYQQPLFEKLVYFKIGKMQPPTSGNNGGNSIGSFFTDDPTVQNVDGLLGSYGVEVGVSPISILTFSYTFLGQDKYAENSADGNGLFSYGYHTFLLTAQPIEKGNYRLGFWYSDITRTPLETKDDPSGSNGVFFSADQIVADYFQLFARFGIRTDKTVGLGQFSQAGMGWQVGSTFLGGLWGRAADSFFLGIGQASYQVASSANDVPNAELHLEVNYSFSLASGISLTPFFQYVSDIYTATTDVNGDYVYDSGMAYGIRTQIKF